jgi:hypothetical protein
MSEKLYEFRETNLPFPKNISIFADNIAFFVWGATPKVFVITSKEQADEYKKFFYTIWKIAKKKS